MAAGIQPQACELPRESTRSCAQFSGCGRLAYAFWRIEPRFASRVMPWKC